VTRQRRSCGWCDPHNRRCRDSRAISWLPCRRWYSAGASLAGPRSGTDQHVAKFARVSSPAVAVSRQKSSRRPREPVRAAAPSETFPMAKQADQSSCRPQRSAQLRIRAVRGWRSITSELRDRSQRRDDRRLEVATQALHLLASARPTLGGAAQAPGPQAPRYLPPPCASSAIRMPAALAAKHTSRLGRASSTPSGEQRDDDRQVAELRVLRPQDGRRME
jgi:hypothetical protein